MIQFKNYILLRAASVTRLTNMKKWNKTINLCRRNIPLTKSESQPFYMENRHDI